MDDVVWAGLWPYFVVLVGAAATYLWRLLGTALSGRVRADSPVLDLIGCIAYALLAGLISRIILLPVGPLEGTSLAARLAATAAGVVVFFALRRNLLAGVAAGAATLSILAAIPL